MIKLVICERCKRVQRFKEWVLLTQEQTDQLRQLYLKGELNVEHVLCPICRPS